jgi:hypothetical protein
MDNSTTEFPYIKAHFKTGLEICFSAEMAAYKWADPKKNNLVFH